jgi:hypothetical protein
MASADRLLRTTASADERGDMGNYKTARGDEMRDAVSETDGSSDLGFLPWALTCQCRTLIQSYHDVHGFTCLPDILWKSGLQRLIEHSHEMNQLLRKASTTRSAKKANQGFVQIAATILSLEVLASSFSGWAALYPRAGELAHATLSRYGRGQQMPLMDFYLYPPKYLSSAALATLNPRPIMARDSHLNSEIVQPVFASVGST